MPQRSILLWQLSSAVHFGFQWTTLASSNHHSTSSRFSGRSQCLRAAYSTQHRTSVGCTNSQCYSRSYTGGLHYRSRNPRVHDGIPEPYHRSHRVVVGSAFDCFAVGTATRVTGYSTSGKRPLRTHSAIASSTARAKDSAPGSGTACPLSAFPLPPFAPLIENAPVSGLIPDGISASGLQAIGLPPTGLPPEGLPPMGLPPAGRRSGRSLPARKLLNRFRTCRCPWGGIISWWGLQP